MFSICCYSRVKSQINQNRSAKNKKIIPFINKYNQEGRNLPSEKDDRIQS